MPSRIRTKDFFILSLFMLTITIPMFLSSSIMSQMMIHIDNPSWWQFFTASFTHHNFNHYINHLILLGMLLVAQVILVAKMKLKTRYYWLLVFTFMTFPVLSAMVQVLIYPSVLPFLKEIAGASGLVSAVFGFIPIIVMKFLARNRKKKVFTLTLLLAIVLYIELLFLLMYYHTTYALVAFIVVLSIILYLIHLSEKPLKELQEGLSNIWKRDKVLHIFILAQIGIFLLVPLILFPLDILRWNLFVDIFTHLFGILYGVIVSFVFFR